MPQGNLLGYGGGGGSLQDLLPLLLGLGGRGGGGGLQALLPMLLGLGGGGGFGSNYGSFNPAGGRFGPSYGGDVNRPSPGGGFGLSGGGTGANIGGGSRPFDPPGSFPGIGGGFPTDFGNPGPGVLQLDGSGLGGVSMANPFGPGAAGTASIGGGGGFTAPRAATPTGPGVSMTLPSGMSPTQGSGPYNPNKPMPTPALGSSAGGQFSVLGDILSRLPAGAQNAVSSGNVSPRAMVLGAAARRKQPNQGFAGPPNPGPWVNPALGGTYRQPTYNK